MIRVNTPDPPPDPSSLPPVPLVRGGIGFRTFFGDRLRFLMRFAELTGEGGIGQVRFGPRTAVLVNTPEAAGEVLLERAADFHKGPALSVYARPLLGNGLLTSEDGFHRRQRQLIAPAFAHKRVVTYAAPMAEVAERAQERWAEGKGIDGAEEMARLTLAIVGQTLFGVSQVADEADELGAALTTAMRFFVDMIRSPLRPPVRVRATLEAECPASAGAARCHHLPAHPGAAGVR